MSVADRERDGSSWTSEAGRDAVRRALGAASAVFSVGLVATDAEGRSWYHNQRFEDLTGAVGIEFRGRPWYEAVHPDDVELVRQRWRGSTDGLGRFGSFRVLGPDGTERLCGGLTVPVVSESGTLDGYLVVTTDVDTSRVLSSPRLVDALLEHSLEIVSILGADGSWRWSSAATTRLVGHIERFDPKTGVFELVHPEDRARAVAEFARVVAGDAEPGLRSSYRVRAAGGEWRTMEAVLDRRLDDPAICGIIVHAWDVTDERRGRQTVELRNLQLSNLIQRLTTGVMLEDASRRVVLTNQAFCNAIGTTVLPEDFVGQTTLDATGLALPLIAVDGARAKQELRTRLESMTTMPRVRTALLDGRTIEWEYLPLRMGDRYLGHIFLVDDVTDRARAEAERERLLESAQRENRTLAELAAQRAEVVASVSHELRTPLTAIVGHAQMLRDMLGARQADEELASVEVILRNVDRLFRLTGDLLILDSLEQGILSVPPTTVDLRQVVERSVESARPEAAALDLTIDTELLAVPAIAGDPDRLGQLVDNLLSNALKFSLPGGTVTVRLETGDHHPRLTIADSGIGIPAAEQGEVFNRFYRASNAQARHVPGRGLGLAIVAAITRIHHGQLDLRSAIGNGTTVTVWLAGIGSS